MCRRGNVSQALLWNSIESGNAENTVAGEQVEKKERKRERKEREKKKERGSIPRRLAVKRSNLEN